MSIPPIPAAPVSGASNGLWTSQPFSTTVDLSGLHYMPQQTVSAVLAFTVGATAAGGSNSVRLVADGVNAPTFTGFMESGLSSGYNNTAGLLNELAFWYDGYNAWFAAAQQVNAQPLLALSSAAITSGTAALALTYSLTLNTTAPATSAFSVTASGGAASVSSVTISGAVVTLNLSRNILSGETVTVSYAAPGTNPLQSTGAALAPSFSGYAVSVSVAAVPTLSSASITSGTAALALAYSLSLNTTAPAASAFSVTASGGAASVSSVAISGAVVTLTLSRNIANGETVTANYTAPGTNPIETPAGGLAASFSAQAVTVGGAAPTLSSAAITSGTAALALTYSLSLNTTAPATSAFAITASAGAASVSSVAISGSTVTLTLSRTILDGETVTANYTAPGTNPIETPAGGLAASFSSQSVTVNAGSTISLSSAALNTNTPTALVLTYGATLYATGPAASAYAVTASGGAVSVSSVAISGATATLTLSRSINGQETMSVSYTTPGANPLQSAAGNPAASFSGQSVTITSTAPTLSSATISGGTAALALAYSLTMATTAPATSAFSITASGGAATVSSVAISGSTVTLTLSRNIAVGETVTCSYTAPGTNPLQSAAGGLAASFSGQAVSVSNFPIAGAQPIQLPLMGSTITQSSDATYSGYYDYTSSLAASPFDTTEAAGSSVGIPASTDGYFGIVIENNPSGATQGPVLGVMTSAAAAGYTSFAYGIYAGATTNYILITGGTPNGTPDTAVAVAAGDFVRLRRITASNQLVAEISKNSGSTWTITKTWSGVTTAKLYMGVNCCSSQPVLAAFSSSGVA